MSENAATAADVTLPPVPRLPVALAWVLFWLLMIAIAVDDHGRRGGAPLWQPLLWEGSSCLVATVVLAWNARELARLDGRLDRPWAWFGAVARRLVVTAPLFVAATYALRHGVYAAIGQTYRHEPWPAVFAYESAKFSLFYLLFAVAFFGLRSHAAMSAQRLRAHEQQRLAQQAQLLQLAQQIEPHFLFNALNTIAETVHRDADLAEDLLVKLASLLRAATDLAREPDRALADELPLLEAYAAIMVRRFEGRVTLRVDVDAHARACRVPSLLLQPLLENAFRHGVEKHAGPASILVSASSAQGRLRLAVEDDIGRLEPGFVDGVGLANLRARLKTAYGDAAALRLEPRPGDGAAAGRGCGVLAVVEMPCVCVEMP
jgi:signal transduction histidine kinase